MKKKNIKRIVFTGGPSSGKSTIIDDIKKKFSSGNLKIITMTEIATLIIGAGFIYRNEGIPIYNFQSEIFSTQINLEKSFQKLINIAPYENVLILYDRNIADCKAYLSEYEFEHLCSKHNLTDRELYDAFDMVIYLETVTKKDIYLFSNETNPSRISTANQSIEFDNGVKKAWQTHKNFHEISAKDTFKEKQEEVFTLVNRFITQNFSKGNEQNGIFDFDQN